MTPVIGPCRMEVRRHDEGLIMPRHWSFRKATPSGGSPVTKVCLVEVSVDEREQVPGRIAVAQRVIVGHQQVLVANRRGAK